MRKKKLWNLSTLQQWNEYFVYTNNEHLCIQTRDQKEKIQDTKN